MADKKFEAEADTGEEQGSGYGKARDGGNQDGGAKHGKQVLHAQHEILGHTQLACVSDALLFLDVHDVV